MTAGFDLLAVMRKASRAVPNEGYVEFDDAIGAVEALIKERDALLVVARDFDEALRERGMRCECGEEDCRTTRLDAALARGTGAQT